MEYVAYMFGFTAFVIAMNLHKTVKKHEKQIKNLERRLDK